MGESHRTVASVMGRRLGQTRPQRGDVPSKHCDFQPSRRNICFLVILANSCLPRGSKVGRARPTQGLRALQAPVPGGSCHPLEASLLICKTVGVGSGHLRASIRLRFFPLSRACWARASGGRGIGVPLHPGGPVRRKGGVPVRALWRPAPRGPTSGFSKGRSRILKL